MLRSLLRCQKSATYEYYDIADILIDIRRLSESMACPVLFVGSQKLKSGLRRALHDLEATDIYDIRRQDGFDKEYVCHIGRCEVYSLRFRDVNYNILTTKELFKTVSFRKISEEQYVDVDFELNKDSDSLGKLKLNYWMKVDLTEDVPCIKLELALKEDDLV